MSGGNVDVTFLARIIERGLVKDGWLVLLRIQLPDHPGALNRLTGVIATKLVNIVETSYERAHYGVGLGDTATDLAIETSGPDHDRELACALTESGYDFEPVM